MREARCDIEEYGKRLINMLFVGLQSVVDLHWGVMGLRTVLAQEWVSMPLSRMGLHSFLRAPHQITQTAGPQTAEIYYLTVLEARNPQSRSWQSRAFSEGFSGRSFLASRSVRWLPAVLALQPHRSSLCFHRFLVFFHLCLFPPLTGAPVLD